MPSRSYRLPSETQRKRSLSQRMTLVHVFLLLCLLIIIARLLELQIVRGKEYHEIAQTQHFGGVTLPAKRGEILSRNSKTGEVSILATNTTLDMVYVDPLITDDPTLIAETLADILVTDHFNEMCSVGDEECPRELVGYYNLAFDPLSRVQKTLTGVLLEPQRLRISERSDVQDDLLNITEVRRRFARDIEDRIAEQRVTFVPLVYGATKVQMHEVQELNFPGIEVNEKERLIYGDPENIKQLNLSHIARSLSGIVDMDPDYLRQILRSRPLRYTPIMRRLSPEISSKIKEVQLASVRQTQERRKQAQSFEAAQEMHDPLRSIALIPEHWRFYPDGTVASHVVGFLNINQEAQYGIERTFNPQLRGQEGLISALSDPSGGQILTSQQSIVDPKDGDTIILTIDRFIQKKVESILEAAVEKYEAESGQVIIMDPFTGRILALANAPLFDSNVYGTVFEKEPIYIDERKQKEVVVEIIHPETNAFILKAYIGDVFTEEGRDNLSEERQLKLSVLEELYDLEDVVRYYIYIGENQRDEIFPTDQPDIWMKYKNSIGVGAYLNRAIQSIYEPGSVLKAVTMAIAIDQGEVTPTDTYDDNGPLEIDEYTIRNALHTYYGTVTMTNCLEFSINTCMTSVSEKLGRKLFHRMLERFGFSRVTGIELEDEQPGEMLPWREWSSALLATAAYGQGVSATPLQVVTAFSALANGGRLMKPLIIDSTMRNDGTVIKTQPRIIDQVITPEASATITAMLTSAVTNGFAKTAKVPGYRIAGKTGTSQIAGPGGKYETGTGAAITSFAGFAPINHPRFTILVKIDRPQNIEYGSESAAPVFKEIATFLFKYYGIPPDEN
ncbi:penicillin-binding protein 2 [Patescibacteria group bacterium]|nr:penicillin-binding protein 2 [Patescibacteria group bacterium]MBU2259909.1 penicillin-binding protein 2 [Patescibacteria group bacterium]